MRVVRVLLTAVILAAVPAVLLAQNDLVVWHAYRGAEKEAFEKVVAQYNASNKVGAKVTAVAVPYDPFADRITAAVPRGKGPDVFIYAQDRLGGWIAAGNVVTPMPLEASVAERYLPGMMQAMTFGGKTYGLPLNFKVITMIYNRKLVPSPPKTSAELEAFASRVKDEKSGQWGLAYWYSNFYYHSMLLNPFVKAAGGGVFNSNRQPTIDTPAALSSMAVLQRWMKFLPPDPSSTLVKTLFNKGKVAIVFDGPWFLGEIDPSIDYALAPLPRLEDAGGTPLRPWITIEGVYIAAPSKHKEAAADFVRYVTDTPAAAIMAIEGRQTPANRAVWNEPRVGNDHVLKVFRQQVTNAVPMPNVPEMTKIWTPVTNAMNAIVKGTKTPKQALATAQQEVEAAIR